MRSHFVNCLLTGVFIGALGTMTVGAALAQEAGPSATAPSATDGPAPAPAAGTAATEAPAPVEAAPAPLTETAPAPAVAPAVTSVETPAAAAPTQAATLLPAPAPYLTGEARLPAADVEAWIAAPRSLFETPVVSDRVSARAERLLGSDARAVPVMISTALAPETSPEERAMVVIGFARATRSAEGVAPEYAAYLQESIVRSGSESLIAAYNVAFQTTEIATSALGGGGAAGGGGGAAGGGSLSGGGDSGNAGSIGGDAVVPTTAPGTSSRGGGSVALSDDNGNDGTIVGTGTNGANGTNGAAGATGPAGTNGTNGNTIIIVLPFPCGDASQTLPNCPT